MPLSNVNASRRRLNEIDGLRAVAISLVVLFHFTKEFFPGHRFFSFGWSGVDLFFVISGFVLYLQVKKKYYKDNTVHYRQYLRNRTLRIVPAYYVSLIITVFLFGMDKLLSGTFLLHLSFLHIFDYDVAMSIQPLYWTLAVEMQFYVFLILAVPFLTGSTGFRWLAVLIVANILYRLIFPFFFSASSQTGLMLGNILPGRIAEFSYGMIIAKIFLEKERLFQNFRRPLSSAGIGLLAALLIAGCWWVWLRMGDSLLDWWITNTVFYPLVGLGYAVLFVLVLMNPIINRIMSSRAIVFTGTISYSVYLWHMFTIMLLKGKWEGAAGFIIAVGITLVISSISYYFIERTFLKLKAR